jgi:histidine triad (HIT) family protein
MYIKDNVFAKIISRNIPATVIYEDDNVLAFNDINPVAPVHVLVVPKKGYVDYTDFMLHASGDEIKGYFVALAHIASLVGLEQDGYRLITNKGEKCGQTVPHFHFHIVGGRSISKLLG